MPTPTRQITGTFKDSHLQPAAGKIVKFTAQTYRTDTVNKIRIDLNAVEVTLDSNGQIPTSPQFTLVCTDATGVAPTPVAYRVIEKFGSRATYWIDVPTGSGALDMADIAPLADPPAQPDVYASLEAMEAGDAATLTAAEAYTDAHSSTGAVSSVYGRTGAVTAQTGDYTAAQVGADTAAARDTAISTATTPLATSSALTTGLAGKQPIDADLTTIAALDSAQAGVVASDGAGWVRKTYAQLKTALSITAADVGADTSAARDTAISTAINNLINSAPGTLDTLGEIATALQADESTAAALATTVAGKQPLDADLTAIAALDASTAGAIASDGAGWVKKTYAQFKTALGLVKADVGLGNVDNTSDVNKPVSTAQAAALAAWPPIQSTAPDPATTHLWIDTTVDPTAYQPLDSDLTAIAALTPADGQLLQWSNGLGAWTVVNPTGNSKLAYAENATGTAQTGIVNGSGSVDLTNMTITVPVTSRPVYLTASIGAVLTVGTGSPLLKIIETTSGGSTQIESSSIPIFATNQSARIVIPMFELATSVASTRTFKLQVFAPASGTPTVTVEHGTSGGRRSTFLAMAG